MINYFQSEWKKAYKSQSIIVCFIFLSVSTFIGLGLYFANQDALSDGTQSLVLWGQLTFYYSQLLFAPMLSIIVSMILVSEFEHNTLDMLKANNISLEKLLVGKILVLMILLIPSEITLFFIYLISLKIAHITVDIHILTQLKWIIFSFITSIPLIIIQIYIFVKTKSFSRSVGFASIGSMGGFILLFINKKIGYIYPYSYPMISLRSRELNELTIQELIFLITLSIIYSSLFYYLTKKELKKIK